MPTNEDQSTGVEARIQTLIMERNAARSDLQEAKAEIATLTEAATTGKGSTEAAVLAAKAEMQATIEDLKGQLRRTTNRSLLLADKIPEEAMDDILEYLDYQYDRLKPEAGAEKPEFADWYKTARKENKVLRAAMKPSVAAKASEPDGEAEAAAGEADPKAAAGAASSTKKPAVIPPKAAVIPPKPGDTGKEVDLSKLKVGTAEYTAAKARLKQLAFPVAAK